MNKIIYGFSFLFLLIPIFANSAELLVEHQIRLCQNQNEILNTLKRVSKDKDEKIFQTYYGETLNKDLEIKNLTLRIREMDDEVDLSLKIKESENSILPDLNYSKCEIDLHANKKSKTCTLKEFIKKSDFSKLVEKSKSFDEILSRDQLDLLKMNQIKINDLFLYGILDSKKYQINNDYFGKINFDFLSFKKENLIEFNEVSVRYLEIEINDKQKPFEDFISNLGLKKCPNQLNWEVDKFKILNIL